MKRKTKACLGCGANFLTLKNYDYCQGCGINGSRYVNKKSPCSECDGSGIIKFRNQKPRRCKLCYLTKKLSPEEQEEKYWDEVNQLAQEKIYHLFTTNIPFQNIPLIKESWQYEEAQQKKVGLFLRRDVDYRTLLVDLENEWYKRVEEEGEELPTTEILAEEVALWYSRLVMKSLISDLSDYSGYDPSLFSNLTY